MALTVPCVMIAHCMCSSESIHRAPPICAFMCVKKCIYVHTEVFVSRIRKMKKEKDMRVDSKMVAC